MKELYLDANAHVPMSNRTLKFFSEFNNSRAAHGHPSSPSTPGREASAAIEKARSKIASLLGAQSPNQIFFTSSCTQACEWVMKIIKKKKLYSYVSRLEHPAVSRAAEVYLPEHHKLEASPNGILDLKKYNAIPIPGAAVSCIHVQNEIGTIQPIEKIGDKYPKALIFSDMSQSLGKVPINLQELDVDFATFGAHKFGGPSGVGFMYLKDTSHWSAFGTGSRYYMDAPGTPNTAGIATTAVALQEALETLPERNDKMLSFQGTLELGLEGLGYEIIGKGEHRSFNTTFAKVPAKKDFFDAGLMLQMKLTQKGIHIGLGSACGSMHTGGSPLMEAIGRPSEGQEYIRISHWGEYDSSDAEKVLSNIVEIS